MLKSTRLTNPVTCFLAPFHAAAVKWLLEALTPEQAVIAAVPDDTDIAVLLRCEDFSADIAAHRLWIVSGIQWASQLEQLLFDQPGLAVPSQFLRLNVTDATLIQSMIDTAQSSFGRVIGERSQRILAMQSEIVVRPARRLCAMTPMRFQLWQDEGFVLSESVPADAVCLDTSDPANAAPLRLARAAIDAGTLLTPNIARCDMPGVVPPNIPWLTWVTGSRVPPFESAGPLDHLLIADPRVLSEARASGWPAERTHSAGWPISTAHKAPLKTPFTVIAHTKSLDTPLELENFSSHRILWETLREEIRDQPSAVLAGGAASYLSERLNRYDIAGDDFPHDQFINDLILPAYAQAIVSSLIGKKTRVQIFGNGWDRIERFESFVVGPIDTRAEFLEAIDCAAALVHVWPTVTAHPIESFGIPIVRADRDSLPPDYSNDANLADAIKRVASLCA